MNPVPIEPVDPDGPPGVSISVALRAGATRPFQLLAYGDPNVDLVFGVQCPPAPGHKVLGRRLGRFAGGTVANAACAASSMGCRVQALGRVGDDADGEFLLAGYASFGVDSGEVRTLAGSASAAAMIMLDDSGEKALVYLPLPGPLPEPARLAAALRASALLYAMPYDPVEFDALHALARAEGTLVAIDVEAAMVPTRREMDRLLSLADLVFMNDVTYRAVFGRDPRLADMRTLLAQGARLMVVTCGAAGALAAGAHEQASQPAFPAALVDSTGAGDCFNGAFLAALFEGRDLQGCLRLACAAASMAVERLGARSGIPTRADVEVRLAEVRLAEVRLAEALLACRMPAGST